MKVRNPAGKGIVIGATVATLTGAIASHVWADAARIFMTTSAPVAMGPAEKVTGRPAKCCSRRRQDLATALKGKTDADIAKVIKEGGAAIGKSPNMPAASD